MRTTAATSPLPHYAPVHWRTTPLATKFYFACGTVPFLNTITCLFHLTLKGLHGLLNQYSCTKPFAQTMKNNSVTNFALGLQGRHPLSVTDLVILGTPLLGNLLFIVLLVGLKAADDRPAATL